MAPSVKSQAESFRRPERYIRSSWPVSRLQSACHSRQVALPDKSRSSTAPQRRDDSLPDRLPPFSAQSKTSFSPSAVRTSCNIISPWNTPSVAHIAGKRFRWFSTCRFAVKATSKTVKFAATQSRSVTAYRTMRSLASSPRHSNR
jgi:hypothetical protein